MSDKDEDDEYGMIENFTSFFANSQPTPDCTPRQSNAATTPKDTIGFEISTADREWLEEQENFENTGHIIMPSPKKTAGAQMHIQQHLQILKNPSPLSRPLACVLAGSEQVNAEAESMPSPIEDEANQPKKKQKTMKANGQVNLFKKMMVDKLDRAIQKGGFA